MNEIKKQEPDQKKEYLQEKQGIQKSTLNSKNEALLASAILKGTILHSHCEELLRALGRIGNYSFLQILERKRNIHTNLKKYEESETFSRENLNILNETLKDDFVQESNEVALLPGFPDDPPIPDLVTEESTYLSQLAPASFDEGVFEQPDNYSTE